MPTSGDKIKLSVLTNMVTPYRVPFFRGVAGDRRVASLRVLVCVDREIDRKWVVWEDASFLVIRLFGATFNFRRGSDGKRIVHIRVGVFSELMRNRPDVLVIGDASWTSYLAALTCLLLRIPYVVWNEITVTSRVSGGILAGVRRWMFKGALISIASCSMAKEYLLRSGVPVSKIRLVNNAVDDQFYLGKRRIYEGQRAAIRKELGVRDNAFCFIYVGQLISRKRVLETIEVLSKARLSHDLHLIVAGSGSLEEKLKLKASELGFGDCTFCGEVDPDRLSQLYVASDALILLSDDEPWGMVINEALLFGKRFLATNSVGAAVEFVELDPNLGVVTAFDFEEVLAAIESLVIRKNQPVGNIPITMSVMATSFVSVVVDCA